MKRSLIFLMLLTLAACTQTPILGDETQPDLAPLVFGGPGDEGVTDLAKHSTGVYTVGFTTNTGRPNPRGEADAFVRKYSSSRSVIWTRKFSTTEYEFASGAASDPSDNVYMAGSISTYTSGGQTAFIRKYRADGQLAWTRRFSDTPTSEAPPLTFVSDVTTYGSKAVYAVGGTYGKLSSSVGRGDIFVRKYTSSGDVSWTRQFDFSDECCRDFVGSVAVDASGNAYVVGATYNTLRGPNNDLLDTFIRKYSPGGSVVWTRRLNFGVIDYSEAVAVSGSNVYLGVSYISDANSSEGYDFDFRIIKFSTSGVRAQGWGFVYASADSDSVQDLSTDRDGNIYLSGTIEALSTGNADGFVVKLEPSGARVWSKRVASSGDDRATAVLARTPSEVYVAGLTSGVLGSANRGNTDPFLRRLRGSDGRTVWTEQ